MRSKIIIVLAVFVLGALNYGIYQKQKIIDNGETILLELAPVDPRSLMQGDYMRLRYDIERSVSADQLEAHQKRGYMVIRPNENNVAQFLRFYENEALNDQEKLLHFHRQNGVRIVPDSFLFQEGHAKYYEEAKYGVFKFDNNGNHLLTGMADEDGEIITVSE
tara:strand:- start:99 stop:587 length:489 start_codon:yes stop_codon:yes gene_type:complete